GFPKPLLLFLLSALLLLSVPASPATAQTPFSAQATERRSVDVKAREAAVAEHRIALVIGNSAYRMGALRNPVNDARAVAATLRDLGFSVEERTDLSYQEMGRAIVRFGQSIRRDSVALFYYAGHGLQVQGSNYLVPVDAQIHDEGEVQFATVNAGLVLAKMEEAKNPVNIVILDACRDNPYARSWKRSSGGRGLAKMDAPVGSIIAYAAGPGETADDGKGKNGLYTESLVRQMKAPGLKIEDVFKRVRSEVRQRSDGRQVPAETTQLEGDFYFTRGTVEAAPAPPPLAMARPPEPPPVPAAPRAGEILRDPVTGMEMVYVPGGCYRMGDTFGDGNSSEKPVHEVCVSDFYIGKYEVTQGQWRQIMGYNPSHFSSCGDNCPVENVSWNDAQNFADKLNNRTGKQYRLPTEAEWEYAAQSGGKSEKWAGTSSESSLRDYAWYDANSEDKTHPVGQKKPNVLGLHDMSGNVWEWCSDGWEMDYYKNSPRDNPKGPADGSHRFFRGGSWSHRAADARASFRYFVRPETRNVNLGFRLVLPLGQ
ncbi:MAG: SUMF1/EgtB/PvdO family nonheme iron enzyme, partial [Syntrophales bacterium]